MRSAPRSSHNGHAATATAHVRAQLTTHAILPPSSVLKGSGSRAHEPPDDSKDHAPRALAVNAVKPRRSPRGRFCATERRSREHSSDHTKVCRHSDEQATLLPAAKLLQPPSAAEHKPNVRLSTGEWMSASAVSQGGLGSKRCSLGVITKCVAAGGHSPRDTWLTLPARRAGRRGFARSVGRMYLPRSSALRD